MDDLSYQQLAQKFIQALRDGKVQFAQSASAATPGQSIQVRRQGLPPIRAIAQNNITPGEACTVFFLDNGEARVYGQNDFEIRSERILRYRRHREQYTVSEASILSLLLYSQSVPLSLLLYQKDQIEFGNVAVLFFTERTQIFPPDPLCSNGCASHALVQGPACQMRCEDGWGQFMTAEECNDAKDNGGGGTYNEYGTIASWSSNLSGGFPDGWTPYFNDPWFDCYIIKAKNGDIIHYHDPNSLGGWEERPWIGSLGAYSFAEVDIYSVGRLRRFNQGIAIVYDPTNLSYQGNYYPAPDWPDGTTINTPTTPPATGATVFIFFKYYTDTSEGRYYYDSGFHFGSVSSWSSRSRNYPPISPYPPGMLPEQINPDNTTNVVDIYLGGDRPSAIKLGTYKRLLAPGYTYNFRTYLVKLSTTESEVIVKYGLTTGSRRPGAYTEYKRYWCFADVYLINNNRVTKTTFTRPQEIILDSRNWAAYALKSWEAGDWEPATGQESVSASYQHFLGYFVGKYRLPQFTAASDFTIFDAYLSRYRGENNSPGIAFAYTESSNRTGNLAPYFGFKDLNFERIDDLPSIGGNFIPTEDKTYLIEAKVRQWDAPRNNILMNTLRTSTQAIEVELEAGEFHAIDVDFYGRHYERTPSCKSINSKIYPLGHENPWIVEISAYVAPEEIEAAAMACKNNRIFRARFVGVNSDSLAVVYDYGYRIWAEKYPFDPYWENEKKLLGGTWTNYRHSPGNSPDLLEFRDCNGNITSTLDAYNLLGGDQLWIIPDATSEPQVEIIGECV